jgi:hypothetical protein
MSEVISCKDHFLAMDKILQTLKAIGSSVPDDMASIALIISLPDDYSHLTTTLELQASMIAYSNLKNIIKQEELKREASKQQPTISMALSAKEKSSGSQKVPGTCPYCSNGKHWMSDCDLRKKDMEVGKQQRLSAAKVSKHVSC